MKKPTLFKTYGLYPILCFMVTLLVDQPAAAQSCPANGTTSISAYPNTYYPAGQANVTAGSKSIVLGSVTYGTAQISSGDILLIIQMQGAEINSNNTSSYGDGTGVGYGYIVNSALLAGNMEYVVASNSVPLTGGTLNITTGLVNAYQNTAFGTDGQYTYQVIRIPVYYDLKLTGTIQPPRWDGTEGGVLVLFATDNINLNTQTIDASGLGFRGAGGRAFTGSGTGAYTDYITPANENANGGKGEGIAGTPKYLNHNNSFLDVSGTEGYPNGSYAKGAPGNAGGGGTDGDPASGNDQNTGGGGGSNGGAGGYGGNSWSSDLPSGGRPGGIFAQASAAQLVMGGGGGAGTTNNSTGTPSGGFASSGTAGGGIVILIAQNAITSSGTIKSNGTNANSTVQNDGAGGAGAGGSVIIFSGNGVTSNISVQAKGGNGGSNEVSGGPSHGPGGGGGGGIVYSNSTLKAGSTVAGGNAGTTNGTTTTYGATSGATGLMVTGMNESNMAQVPLNCIALAASFIDVTAQPNNGVVNVGWTIARESTTTGYIVERSSDGVNFTAIGNMPYQESNTVNTAYQYADNGAYGIGGTLYYRIRETETGGQLIYSKIVSVKLDTAAGKLTVYPNPAKNMVTVSFTMTASEAISLRLFDTNGSQLWQRVYQASAGQNSLQIDRMSTLPDGIYLLQWFDGLNPRMVKVFVQH
jgi:hypothetical protein